MFTRTSSAVNQVQKPENNLVHPSQACSNLSLGNAGVGVNPPQSLIRKLTVFAPCWSWHAASNDDTCYVADLAGVFLVQVLRQTVILYGHDQSGPLANWFITPDGGGLAAALQACRADVSQRISELYRILG